MVSERPLDEQLRPGEQPFAGGTGGAGYAPPAGGGPVEVVRSQERAVVGVTPVVSRRVRVARRIVTEERTVTVQVRREEVVVEELPVDAGAPPAAGAAGAREPIVLVLREEEVRVEKVVVPRELVRVVVDRETGTAVVDTELAREEVELTGVSGDPVPDAAPRHLA